MTDQVESLDVGFQDGVSANAKKATDALTGLGDAAIAAETKTTRAGRGMKKATDEVAAGAAAAKKAIDDFGGGVERSTEPVKRASQTVEQLASRFSQAGKEASAVARAVAPYDRALRDLEKSTADATEKEKLSADILAQKALAADKAREKVARYFKAVQDGAAAATASAGGMDAGMKAATASAGSWAGALGKVHETAGSMATGLNAAARALQLVNADFKSGHASLDEWSAAAKGLEGSLRGVSAAQKAINESTGVSRQNVNTATIGPLKHAVTGNAAPTGNTLGLVVGDADASVKRLGDIEAAFAAADATVDGYRESLGLADAAQRKFEAGQKELQKAIRLAGVEEAEAVKLLDAYAAAHDPALKKMVADWDAAARERDANAQMILADEKAIADAAQKTAAENAKLAASYSQVMGAVDPAVAAEQRYQKALGDLRAGAAAAGVSMDQLAADEAKLTAAINPAALAAKKEEEALRSLIGGLDKSYFATESLAKQQAMLDKALHEGVGDIKLSANEHAALSKVIQDQHAVMTRSATGTKLAAHEMTNLTYQIQDTFVSLAGGQNPFLVLMQQGPQATSAVGGVGRAMALLLSPVTLAVLGGAALAGGLALIGSRAAEISARTRQLTVDIQAMGNASGVSAGQLRAIETQLRHHGVSSDAAFASVRTLAGARGLPTSILGDVADIGRNMAATTGDVAGAVGKLTDAMTQGYQGIAKLDDEFNFLSASERQQIEAMARHGDQAGVLSTAIGALHRQFDGLHEKSLSPAGAAFERMTAAYNGLIDAIASRPIVIKGLEGLAWLLEKSSKGIVAPTRIEQIGELRRELATLEAQYSRLPERNSGTQTAHEAIILRRIELQTKLNRLQSEDAATQSSQIRTGAPRTAGTSNARSGTPDPAAAKYVEAQADAYDRLSAAMQGNAVQRALAAADMRADDDIRDRRLTGLAADELRTLRHKEALLQLTVAVNDNNRAAMAEIAGNELVARAYGVSSAAVREATIQQKAMAEAARGTIEPYDAIVARLRAVDDATRKVQAAQFDATLRQQTEDANRLADAWGKGAAAAREAALANEVLGEARKRGLDPTRDAGEIRDIGQGVLARDAAQRSQQFAQMASEQRRAVDLANAEFDVLGQSNAERAKTVAILQASNDLRDKGADLTDAGTKAYIEQAGELAKVKSILQDATQTAANITQPIASGLEDVIVGAKGAGDAVKALGEDLKRIAARQLVTKPFETAVSGALTRLMSGGVSVANDNRPTPANDPGTLGRLVSTVSGGLGSSASNAMWVQMSSGSAAYDVGAMLNGSPMPVSIKDGGTIVDMLRAEARGQGVPEEVVLALAKIESNFQQYRADGSLLRSSAGAQGVMQLMPGTAKWLGVDAADTQQNIQGGVKFLSMLGRQFGGDWTAAVGAYNAGAGRMSDYLDKGRALPAETVQYIQKFGTTVKTVSADVLSLRTPMQGVTAAQEAQLQTQLDAIPIQRAVADSAQALSGAQQSLIDSVLGTATASNTAASSIEVLARPMDKLADGAISAAEAQMDAANGAGVLANAATGFAGTVSQAASGLWSWVSSLFSSSPSSGGSVPGAASQSGTGPNGAYSSLTNSVLSKGASWGMDKMFPTTGITGAVDTLGYSALGIGSVSYGAPVVASNGMLVGGGATSLAAPTGITGGLGTTLSAAAPYGALGGMVGSYISNNYMGGSKVGGAAVGALAGVGTMAAGTAAMGAMGMGAAATAAGVSGMAGATTALAAIPVYGWIAAAVMAAVMAAVGSQKPSVGPNAQGNVIVQNGRYAEGPSAADNDGDPTNVKRVTASVAQGFNALADAYGLKIADKNFGYWEGGTEAATGNGVHNDPKLLIRQMVNEGISASDPNSNVAKALASDAAKGVDDLETLQKYLDVAHKIDNATAAFAEMSKTLDQVKASAKAASAEGFKAIDEEIKTSDIIGLGKEYRTSLEASIRSTFEGAVKAWTPMETAMAQLSGQTEAWVEAVTRWGVGISEAEIRADAAAKAEKLRQQAMEEYTTALYSAQGRDYLTQLGGIAANEETIRRNLAAVGVVDAAAKASTLVGEQAKNILKGLDAGQLSDAANTLTGAFADLARGMLATRQAASSLSVERAIDPTRKDTAGDILTSAGVMAGASFANADFVRGIQNYLDTARAGTATANDLRWVQALLNTEMVARKITESEYNTLLGTMTQTYTDGAAAVKTANDNVRQSWSSVVSSSLSAAQSLASQWSSLYDTLRDKRLSNMLGEYSTLSPGDQLDEARKQFRSLLAVANDNDPTDAESIKAAGKLGAAGDALLKANQSVNATADPTVFREVQAGLSSVESVAERQLSAANRQVTYLSQIADTLRGLDATLSEQSRMEAVLATPRNWGASESVNANMQLALKTGYSGDFGSGGWQAWIVQQPESVKAVARQVLTQMEQAWRINGFEAGGVIPLAGAYADGGVVGNGLWGKDSVLARYAGGGAIALAGGEFVMPADMTAAYRPELDAMRSGTWEPANDRWSGSNIVAYRPPAPPAPAGADNSAAINRLSGLILKLIDAIEDAEADAQDQRAHYLAKLLAEIKGMRAEQLDELPKLIAGAGGK